MSRRDLQPHAGPPRPKGLIQYYGGKARLAPWIVELMPSHIGYCEPFCGGARVLFQKPRSRMEVINDLDGGVVAAFRAARDYPEDLATLLTLTPHSREEYLAASAVARDGYQTVDLLEAARAFFTLTQQGFGAQSRPGGGWRINRAGTLGGRAENHWKRLPEIVMAAAERLRGVAVEHRSALDVIEFCNHPSVLLYCDPPYHPQTCNVRGYAQWMTIEDHCALAEALRAYSGMVMLSGFRHPDYDVWYEGWHSIERNHTSSTAAGVGSTEYQRTEVLWFNDAAWDRLQSEGSCVAASDG